MSKRTPAKLTKVKVSLPFGIGEAEWTPDSRERRAAWSLYVELLTRIAVQPLELDQGLLREALTSLHSLFASTREVLREAGPEVGVSKDSVGGIAISVLNHQDGLRPFLAKWHPKLRAWESQKLAATDPQQHEQNWEQSKELRNELDGLREKLGKYAQALAAIAGVNGEDRH